MKKVLFLQIKGKSRAGVWFVNKTIGESLIENGYDVFILSIRDNPGNIVLEHDEKLKLHTVNKKDLWEISRKKDIKSIKTLIKYIKEHKKLKEDYDKAAQIIREYKPDYIISSHYQCLDFIPNEYKKRTINIQHSSMKDVLCCRSNLKTLKKYNNKIFGFVWLSHATKNEAKKLGFINNYCLYNPIKFATEKRADVVKNKKLICITRIENERKRINLMLKIVERVLKKNPLWIFELYGFGTFDEECLKIIDKNKNIKFMGATNDSKKKLLNASINLNTSIFEGFSLSILEACACGVPTISFNFGESVYEEIENGNTGIIIENDEIDSYVESLNQLMKNETLLESMSENSKKFSKKFNVKNIIKDWIDIFEKIDKKNKESDVE